MHKLIKQSTEIIDTLILVEYNNDKKLKEKNPKLEGDSAVLFHLKKLKELIMEINEGLRKGIVK